MQIRICGDECLRICSESTSHQEMPRGEHHDPVETVAGSCADGP